MKPDITRRIASISLTAACVAVLVSAFAQSTPLQRGSAQSPSPRLRIDGVVHSDVQVRGGLWLTEPVKRLEGGEEGRMTFLTLTAYSEGMKLFSFESPDFVCSKSADAWTFEGTLDPTAAKESDRYNKRIVVEVKPRAGSTWDQIRSDEDVAVQISTRAP